MQTGAFLKNGDKHKLRGPTQRSPGDMISFGVYSQLDKMILSYILTLKSGIRVIIFLDVSHQVLYNYIIMRCPLQLVSVYCCVILNMIKSRRVFSFPCNSPLR